MERGGDCVERNGSERAKVASVAERKPPASAWHVERLRLMASARYEKVNARSRIYATFASESFFSIVARSFL